MKNLPGNYSTFASGREKLETAWKRTDIFAFPSYHEEFSLALTEALSCGIPAVGDKNCPAVNELIQDGLNALLEKNGN